MHILTAQPGRIDDGEEAVDLEQTPGDIVVLSAADTELAGLAAAAEAVGDVDGPSVRLANLMALSHPFSIDLYADKTLIGARLIVVRVLGGRGYWSYGLDRLSELCAGHGIHLAVLPGDAKPDRDLTEASNVPAADCEALWRYLVEGGAENYALFLAYCRYLVGHREQPEPARPLPAFGLYDGGSLITDEAAIAARFGGAEPRAAIVFYRALVQAAQGEAIAALADALRAQGLTALPLFVSSLKDPECAGFVDRVFETAAPAVILNATAFALSKGGGKHRPTPLDRPGAPVLQVVLSGSSREAWLESERGLSLRDLTMNVVLPELDGRLLTRAISFKADQGRDPVTQFRVQRPEPDPERIRFVASLAANWARLAAKPAGERRVALILANYPNRDGRIANGVGLDTPASSVAILKALTDAGYTVNGAPETSDALMAHLLAGRTNAAASGARYGAGSASSLSDAEYAKAFVRWPVEMRDKVETRWPDRTADPFWTGTGFDLPVSVFGNVAIGIQPARGYNIDPKDTYHDPALAPPHGYLAFYLWLRDVFQADAVIHVGKHGNLEWLPGKALSPSAACFPEAALGPLPNIYPFIVNDPGEGSQAKRRTSAVIIDHLTPPMTRAETYGPIRELEILVDEFYLAASTDPRRAAFLEKEILDLAASHGVDKDLGLTLDPGDPDALQALDAHLCDLKEMQIRDGLHILGAAPEGRQRTDLLTALARVPRGPNPDEASLHRALASDLGLAGFDPLDCVPEAPWTGPRPTVLAMQTRDPWRSAGDSVERLELLAAELIAGEREPAPDWTGTRTVLDSLTTGLAVDLDQSGAAERAALLRALDGRFVEPGPSGAPSRGRPDVLPTGRNFYSVDVRAVPTEAAWRLGMLSADRLVQRYFEDEGDWPKALVLTCWGTSNMRTGGDDIAQALALIGARPVWEKGTGRVTGFEIMPLSDLRRPRIDVTLRISGFFRDAFAHQIDLFDSAVRAVGDLDEPESANPIAAAIAAEAETHSQAGMATDRARRRAGFRIYGSMPGAYGAGLQALIDERIWTDRADFAEAFLTWGGFAYGKGAEGEGARDGLETRLGKVDAVVQNQDNREHDLLDSDDYYQFEGGLSASVETLRGAVPRIYHNDHSRPERPVIRSLDEEIARVVRGRAGNPKWIAGVMRHGYKGAFEMAATVDYLFAFAATTPAVRDHHFDQLYTAYLQDADVLDFLRTHNAPALGEMAERFLEAIERGLWAPKSNSAFDHLAALAGAERNRAGLRTEAAAE